MKRFVEGEDRKQAVLLPEYLEDYVSDDNPVRVVDVFVDELDLHDLGFDGTAPAMTGRPSYHPSVLLKSQIPPAKPVAWFCEPLKGAKEPGAA
ncbi:hypothetical protein R69658_08134 [Paraburkholderia aspalathi]|uniref:Transposase InsH N-terminal domain-containing protein n=1 Tax=Paraburkholderia aspalathi TaxID=1324617 RepID=A0ABN7NDQ1_9BURK|nr:hypothetical protein R69658_08134 [Paraburkholderia aspalathi]CAE6879193.1 hypothetical protein R69746_08900 [Paraburkholderia aspalathi]